VNNFQQKEAKVTKDVRPSATGAAFTISLGQRPRDLENVNRVSAEGAIHRRHGTTGIEQNRLNRAFSAGRCATIETWGVAPGCK
jgi:hypothetical protein